MKLQANAKHLEKAYFTWSSYQKNQSI